MLINKKGNTGLTMSSNNNDNHGGSVYFYPPETVSGNVYNHINWNSSTLMTRGMVLAWTGDNVPTGWALCDGNNGTPDLRARFILGRDPRGGKNAKVTGDDYNIMKGVGGNQTHQLSVGEMPAHSHKTGDIPKYGTFCWKDGGCDPYWSKNSIIKESTTTGNNEDHNNMPPYFVLAYIMKL
jgi:microcystin-dependent protein